MNFVYWALNTMLDSVPIMRRREYGDKMDNCEAFANLIKVYIFTYIYLFSKLIM